MEKRKQGKLTRRAKARPLRLYWKAPRKKNSLRELMKKYLCLPILFLAAAILLWPFRHNLTAEGIAAWSPRQAGLAAVFLLALYAVKGLSMALPLSALEAAAGLVLPLPAALTANICGVALAQTLPYLMGRRRQRNLRALESRWPRLAALEGEKKEPPGRKVFLLRLGGVLPGDLVSLYLGAAGIPLGPYLTGSLLGSLPRIAAGTLLGAALWDLGGARFWLSLAAGWGMTGLALLLWRLDGKRAPSRRSSSA